MISVSDSYEFSYRHKKAENQDACFTLSCVGAGVASGGMRIQAVADGVSSSNGRISARTALEAAYGPLAALLADLPAMASLPRRSQDARIREAMQTAVREADSALRAHAGDCGSTISIAVMYRDRIYTCNIGDSPIYLLKGIARDPSFLELYHCQNEAAERVRRGEMTREEARLSPFRNHLIRSLGETRRILNEDIPIFVEALAADNVLLMGSDGALSVLRPGRSEGLMQSSKNMQNLVERIYEEVDETTDAEDNFTALASRILVN